MKKVKITLSIIAVILSCISILIFITQPSWDGYSYAYFLSNYFIKSNGGNIIYLLGCLAMAIVLLGSINSKGNCSVEIVTTVCLAVVLPLIRAFGENHVLYNFGQEAFVNISSACSTLLALMFGFANVSAALCLVTSGMRIAEKLNAKNQGQNYRFTSSGQ